MKILIVDDNTDNLDMMMIMLKSENYDVTAAGNGKEALDKLRSEEFDLIISDILMPVMDGFQFCRECKKDTALSGIAFIFYTATYIDSKDEEFAMTLGAQKFIRKPQEPDVFLNHIKEVIETSKDNKSKLVKPEVQDESEVMKLYNERLIAKLEKKNADLEKEIEAHRKTEKELVNAKEKAEESNNLKSAFLANISHEVRTPMNGIMGFINLLKRPAINADDQKNYLEIIEKSCNQLLSIITNIIEISTLDTKQLIINKSPSDIPKVLNTLYTFFSKTLPDGHQVVFKKNIHPSVENCICYTDENKLMQILTNLIGNAIKFTQEGTIEMECRLNNSNELEFSVKDTGIGIAKENHEMIFENFRQVEISHSKQYGGLGLGLSIAKEYVIALGGRIWVDSKLGKGSAFYFTIPDISPEENIQPEENPGKSEDKNLSGKVILVAEDDNFNFSYLEKVLNDKNVRIIRAQNGKEAVEICRANPEIDLVLMDIRMPVLNGYEATEQILKFRKNLPIVAQTAYTFFNNKEKALKAGCTAYIEKPIDSEKIMKCIEKYL